MVDSAAERDWKKTKMKDGNKIMSSATKSTKATIKPSNKEVEARAVFLVRKYFQKNGKTLSDPKPLRYGYDYDVKESHSLIEIKGFTAPDSDKSWFNLSRLADRGSKLAKEKGESYELHIIQFKTRDLNGEYSHWCVKGQNVSHIYNTQRSSWEATGNVRERMVQYAERITDP